MVSDAVETAPRYRVTVVLVDVDGTLVDTNEAHARAWVEVFAGGGHDVPYAKVRSLIGMGADQMLPRLLGIEKESPEGKRLAQSWGTLFRERYLPFAKPLPGAADLLRRIHDRGAKLVAASSGEEDIADALLERVGAKELLADRTTSKDAKRSKPAPDLIEIAVKKGGAEPGATILLGDAPYDIAAAQPVGVGVIALRSGGFSDEALAGALALYDDPADLLAHWDDSPLAAIREE